MTTLEVIGLGILCIITGIPVIFALGLAIFIIWGSMLCIITDWFNLIKGK